MIKFGDLVKDKITEFEGIAVAKTNYLNGCVQYELQPKVDKEYKVPESVWFDEQQLLIVSKSKKKIIFDKEYLFKLGDELKDEIMGFRGIVVSITYDINNRIQYELQPKLNKDGEIPDACHIDETYLKLIKPITLKETKPAGGGKRNHPPKR